MFEMLKDNMALLQAPCPSCNMNFNEAVTKLRRDAEDCFQGFSLDCIQSGGSEEAVCRVKGAMHIAQPGL